MITLELDGYPDLDSRLKKLEQIANEGIVNPGKALACCRQIRSELYGVQQLLRSICVIPENGQKEDPYGEPA